MAQFTLIVDVKSRLEKPISRPIFPLNQCGEGGVYKDARKYRRFKQPLWHELTTAQ